ncbi:MAG: thiamine-monophosphate kinase [Myxococcaceae bacterium]
MNLSESQVIELIKASLKPVLAAGAHDLLDDGASLPPCPPGCTRVVSLDAFQENNDFKIGLGSLESAGYRALVQNLSDLAAMGAKPVGFLWSLELPSAWLSNNALYLGQFCTGVLQACQKYNLEFYGGDLSTTKHAFSCAITIFGDVLGKPLGRQGAKPGDKIYVSRELGASAALKYQSYPEPELELGQQLISTATACMDISDGLAKDLTRLCKASKVGARIHTIPTHHLATKEQALYGGEDYALLFTGKKGLVEIGEITESPEILILNDSEYKPLINKGFDHFEKA